MDFSLQSGNQISLKRDEKQTPFAFMTRKVNGDVDYINIILVGISILMVILSIGLYFYNASLAKNVADKKIALDQKQTEIKNLPIQEIRSLYKKLKYANEITRNYNVMDTMFILLGKSIENTAVYNDITLQKNKLTGGFDITLNGVSDSYKTLVQQRNAFFTEGLSKYFSDSKIANFGLDKKTSKITFKLTADMKFSGLTPEDAEALLFGVVRSPSVQTQATSTP